MNGDVPLDLASPLVTSDCAPESVGNVENNVDPATWKRVFQYAYSLVHNQAEAEDLTQEAFVVLFREQKAGRPVERMNAWMRTVTKHLLYRQYHKQRPDLHVPLDLPKDDNSIPWELPDTRPSPEKQTIDQAMLRLSAKILYEFPERDRECILMYVRGYDFQQIASVVGLSRWTARRLTLRALSRLQARINPLR